MCSGIHHTQYLFKPEPLHYSVHKMIVRANRKISSVPVLKLQTINRRDDSPLKGFIRRYFLGYEEHQFRRCELAENHAHKTIKSDDEAEKEELVNLAQNSESDGRIADDSNGNGNSRGNGNKNGNGGDHGGDEGQECSQDNQFPGIEWWMWWKWQQACSKTRYDSTQSSMWPVNAAIQAVANEVLEPAVHAVILKPIKQHINMYRFILVFVFVAFVFSSIQMVAGLAIVSTSISSLAGLVVFAVVLTWLPCKQRGRQRQRNNEDDNGES